MCRTVSTYIYLKADNFSTGSYVIHKEDLSDLGEPYLSAVIEARKHLRQKNNDLDDLNDLCQI